ncbi:MAG TPA: acyl carrier protein [Solirubrobacteraceae bacterium]|jgi:acyl carrier protein|nr:acyl carrier protein [Solirubrobacteraceae bacterium]
MDSVEFFEKFKEFLVELDPGLDLEQLTPDTHLWAEGYLDSFAMLNVVAFIEDETGHEVALDADALPAFFTVERMYLTYIAPHGVTR